LACHFYSIDAFDETIFCQLLTQGKLDFAKMKILRLRFDQEFILGILISAENVSDNFLSLSFGQISIQKQEI
jgi:hypothetical protein